MNDNITNNAYIYLDDKANKCTVFNKLNFTLYNIPFAIGKILNDLVYINDEYIICRKYNINLSQLKNIIDKFNSIFDDNNEKSFSVCNDKILKVLRLIISNTCNLKCKYCYAHEGTYQSQKPIMQVNEAKEIIDKLLSHFEFIEEISFFGGEPLLNIEVIEFVCNYITNKFYNHELKKVPRFSLVTNGTLIDDRIIQLVLKYNLHITVSIDGPKDINDELRVDKFGNGKFDLIKSNVSKLNKCTLEPTLIECTYTSKHLKKGYSYENLQEFLSGEFNVKTIFINPVDISEDNESLKDLKLNESDIKNLITGNLEYRFNNFLKSDLYDTEILRFITTFNNKNKEYPHFYCNAGMEQLAINTTGDIYPCQLFVGLDNNKFYMGNIFKDGLMNDNYKRVQDILLKSTKCNNDKCRSCSERYICNTCIGSLYKKKKTLTPCSDKHCSLVKKNNNMFIKEAIKIYTDTEKHDLLCKKLTKLKNDYSKRGIEL